MRAVQRQLERVNVPGCQSPTCGVLVEPPRAIDTPKPFTSYTHIFMLLLLRSPARCCCCCWWLLSCFGYLDSLVFIYFSSGKYVLRLYSTLLPFINKKQIRPAMTNNFFQSMRYWCFNRIHNFPHSRNIKSFPHNGSTLPDKQSHLNNYTYGFV